MNWIRVTRAHPCACCKKDSWCLFQGNVAICMRQASDRPKQFSDGSVGYLHTIGESNQTPIRIPKPPPEPVINVGKMLDRWHEETEVEWLKEFAMELGVEWTSLAKLGCCWAKEHQAWGFGMRDGHGNLVGIRLRTRDGHKFAVRGSHQGVFLPGGEADLLALICEGPTDTAAALTLGFYAVGRPSCSGGMQDIMTAFRRLRVSRAVLIADADDPGVRGAQMLQEHLRIASASLVLPTKDLRAFVTLGGTRDLLNSMIDSLVWNHP